MSQSLQGRTVLVTGASGGLGVQFVRQALERGAARVYAAARTPKPQADERVRPLTLDITDAGHVAAAVAAAPGVDLLVNNAGIAPEHDRVLGPEEELRAIFETNFFGSLRVASAFGGGTVLSVLSLAAWASMPTGYAVSKAAMWAATNALRVLLQAQNTQVTSLLVGMVDTPMSARWDVPRSARPRSSRRLTTASPPGRWKCSPTTTPAR